MVAPADLASNKIKYSKKHAFITPNLISKMHLFYLLKFYKKSCSCSSASKLCISFGSKDGLRCIFYGFYEVLGLYK